MNSKQLFAAVFCIAVAIALVPASGGHATIRAAAAAPATETYLALGDGLTAGYQGDNPEVIPWSHGWAFQLRDMLAKTSPTELVDLGHTGECTDTFIKGGMAKDCPKITNSPSQVAEASGFLADHDGLVRLITVHVGADNLYVEAGIWYSSRADAGSFPAALLGKSSAGPDIKWLDIRPSGPDHGMLREIMQARAQMCKSAGFDAVDWDIVNEYQDSPSFPITAADQLAYNTFLASAAHSLGLAVGLDMDPDQVAALQPKFDFAVSENCFKNSWCDALAPFVHAGKAVIDVESSDNGMKTSMFCAKANSMHFSAALSTSDLDGTAWKACR